MSRELKARRARERLAVLVPDFAAGAEALRIGWEAGPAGRVHTGPLRDLAQSLERDARTIDALLAKLEGA